ncbi:MAG: S8 family peptidase, partial [Pirellulales bacterium]
MTRAFFRVSKKRSPVRRPRRGTHLQVERLEDRSLLSANPLFDPASSDALGLLVRFREDVTDLSGMAILEGTEIGSPIAPTLVPGLWEIKLAEAVRVEDALAAYQANPLVLYAGADSYGQVDALPDDPLFPSLWGLHNTGQTGGTPDADIDAPEAWEVTTGSTRTVVALIDSGVGYNHLDLYKNIWVNQGEIPASRRANLTDVDGDGLITFWDLNDPVNQGPYKITDFNGDGRISGSDTLAPMNKDASGNDLGTGGWADGLHGDGNGFADDLHGWDFANNDNNPLDDNGHGTHVAGTIAAVGDNGIGVTGVNWRVQVMLVKGLSAAGLISTANAIRSLNYAVANAAPVSNNSYGGFSASPSQAYFDAIRSARNAGHIFVASAGNTNTSNDLFPHYPSAFDLDYILTVAATDSADDRAAFSSFGATSVDLGAPGAPILSTTVNSTYGLNFGTSMAAPHVTGVVALLRT